MNEITEELAEKYGNLVHSLTYYFRGYKEKEDLYQAGFIGLMDAYLKYDDSYGVKFSTFAYKYILGAMKKAIREDKGIKISRDITKLHLKIEKARLLLGQSLYREPTITELSNYLDIEPDIIEMAINSVNIMSIDEPIMNDENETSLHEVISDKEIDIDSLIALKTELGKLSDNDRLLMQKRYYQDMSQSEVANMLGMTQVQVSRQEQKIKQKLKDKLTV